MSNTIFSESLDSGKAPVLFVSVRLSEIEHKAKQGIANPDDVLWLIQEHRQTMSENLKTADCIKRNVLKLDTAIRECGGLQ